MTSPLQQIHEKIAGERQAAARRIAQWRTEGAGPIVFTNGCFDLVHRGHLTYLAQAAALGDRLVVGVNSDASIRRLKGPHRPIVPLPDRMFQLAALFFVDLVVPFDEDTPHRLIQAVAPDVLVKGGDYRPDEVVGKDVVEARGGRVVILPFVEGYSTTSLVERIRQGG